MRIHELFEAALIYRGYPCTKDCSGHMAGYNYASLYDIPDDECPYGSSNSFWEGCLSYTAPGDYGTQEESLVKEKWSEKYKRSIDCSNPKGFSQRAHCQGRKKNRGMAESVPQPGPSSGFSKRFKNDVNKE